MTDTTVATITIDRVAQETVRIPLTGTAPLIVHNFSEKSKRQMLEAQQGKKARKETRNPAVEYDAAFYRYADPDGTVKYGFPVTAFKAATIGAARLYGKDVKMTELRQVMFFRGVISSLDPQQLVLIEGEPTMREDIVRLGGISRSADLRYRPEFSPWRADLLVTYVKSSIDLNSVLSLIDAGGLTVGVGEWRPERKGEYGTFAIDQSRNVEVIQ